MLCSAAACCSPVQGVRNQCCRLLMASKVPQGIGPLVAAPMPMQPALTPAPEVRSTCSPTNQMGRWHSCTSCWPGQAPPPGLLDHRLAAMTAARDAGGAAPRPDRPLIKRFAARTRPSTALLAAPRGAPPVAALALGPDAWRSRLS